MNKNLTNIPFSAIYNKIILFDGECNLCNVCCRFIMHHDKQYQFKFASMQSNKGIAILKHLLQPTTQFETLIYIEDNRVYEKSDAFIKIVKYLRFPASLFSIIRYIPKTFRDFVYDVISSNRNKLFGKCNLPTSEQSRHYL